jgi:hypothetical protein
MNTDTPDTNALNDKLVDISPDEKSDYWLMKLHAQKLERKLATVTAQRDRLAEALKKLADCDWVITLPNRMDAVRTIANEALQSITPKPISQ